MNPKDVLTKSEIAELEQYEKAKAFNRKREQQRRDALTRRQEISNLLDGQSSIIRTPWSGD